MLTPSNGSSRLGVGKRGLCAQFSNVGFRACQTGRLNHRRLGTLSLSLFIPSATGPTEKQQITDDGQASCHNQCG